MVTDERTVAFHDGSNTPGFRVLPTKHPFLWFITAVNLVILLIPTAVIFVASFEGGSTVSFPPDSLSVLVLPDSVPDGVHRRLREEYSGRDDQHAGRYSRRNARLLRDDKVRHQVAKSTADLPIAPFMIPLVVSGIIFTTIFGQLQIYGETWTIGLALTIINLPFMLWSVNSRVNAIDKETENAAKNLGAEELQTFVYVTFPKLLPGIITGALIMFTLGLNEFVVSLLITTRDTVTLPVMLYTAIRSDISPLIAAIASIYILIAIVAVLAVDKVASLEDFLKS